MSIEAEVFEQAKKRARRKGFLFALLLVFLLLVTFITFNSLLEFESSIEKEMEASLMIGKQLNYDRARALALEGDMAGAAREVANQVGGLGGFNRMNVFLTFVANLAS